MHFGHDQSVPSLRFLGCSRALTKNNKQTNKQTMVGDSFPLCPNAKGRLECYPQTNCGTYVLMVYIRIWLLVQGSSTDSCGSLQSDTTPRGLHSLHTSATRTYVPRCRPEMLYPTHIACIPLHLDKRTKVQTRNAVPNTHSLHTSQPGQTYQGADQKCCTQHTQGAHV